MMRNVFKRLKHWWMARMRGVHISQHYRDYVWVEFPYTFQLRPRAAKHYRASFGRGIVRIVSITPVWPIDQAFFQVRKIPAPSVRFTVEDRHGSLGTIWAGIHHPEREDETASAYAGIIRMLNRVPFPLYLRLESRTLQILSYDIPDRNDELGRAYIHLA